MIDCTKKATDVVVDFDCNERMIENHNCCYNCCHHRYYCLPEKMIEEAAAADNFDADAVAADDLVAIVVLALAGFPKSSFCDCHCYCCYCYYCRPSLQTRAK